MVHGRSGGGSGTFEGNTPFYQIIAKRENSRDILEIRVAVSEKIFFDEMKLQRSFLEEIRHEMNKRLGLKVEIKLVERKTLEKELKQSSKIVDEREL